MILRLVAMNAKDVVGLSNWTLSHGMKRKYHVTPSIARTSFFWSNLDQTYVFAISDVIYQTVLVD